MGIDKNEIASLARRDPLSWGIFYFDLLEDKKWEIESRMWSIEPFQMLNPWVIERYPIGTARRMSIIKSTQAGISTMALVKALHFATNWKVRIGYTLPRQQDTLDFVTTRVDPVIQASPYLKSKLGQPDSAHAKRIGDSYLFFIEMSTEPRMMPLDSLYVDEIDLSNPDNLSTVLNRLDASRWKLNFFLSTPTLPNFGIHGIYNTSDMREWMVKCPQCNTDQVLDWEQNLRVIGPPQKPNKVFFGCVKCNRELTHEIIQSGQWVPQHPDLSKEHIGYHISQMMTHSPEALYAAYRDPQTKLVEFYRKRLGKPYEIGGGSIERDDFLVNCFDEPYDFENSWDGQSSYFMGIDQGNELQVLVAKVERDSRRPKIVHVELVPIDRGFDRVAQLMDLYRVKRAVVDGSPNRHAALGLLKRFPGRVLLADYIEQKETWKAKNNALRSGLPTKHLSKIITNVTINRTAGFDSLVDAIKKGEWQLPGNPPALHPDVELIIDHVTAIKRDIEIRRTPSGEVQVAIWKKVRADHLAHAWLYLKIAIEIDKGRNVKVAVIGKGESGNSNIEDEDAPHPDVVVGITGLLAEVPGEQIAEYLGALDRDYELPFPLSYKLRLAKDNYEEPDILWVMQKILEDKQRVRPLK